MKIYNKHTLSFFLRISGFFRAEKRFNPQCIVLDCIVLNRIKEEKAGFFLHPLEALHEKSFWTFHNFLNVWKNHPNFKLEREENGQYKIS